MKVVRDQHADIVLGLSIPALGSLRTDGVARVDRWVDSWKGLDWRHARIMAT